MFLLHNESYYYLIVLFFTWLQKVLNHMTNVTHTKYICILIISVRPYVQVGPKKKGGIRLVLGNAVIKCNSKNKNSE